MGTKELSCHQNEKIKNNSCNLKQISISLIQLCAGLAQLVEQRIRNAWVECSSHLTGTTPKTLHLTESFFFSKDIYLKLEFINIAVKSSGEKISGNTIPSRKIGVNRT